MWKSLGNWTFAFEPYLSEGLPAYFNTPWVRGCRADRERRGVLGCCGIFPLIPPSRFTPTHTPPSLPITAAASQLEPLLPLIDPLLNKENLTM